ncbi:hypothetical protein BD408DRAFT_470533 [Parasitella parasitica]|nr:hypothetical protein BD408DRAFT_470533 [Parasitella parasitica]
MSTTGSVPSSPLGVASRASLGFEEALAALNFELKELGIKVATAGNRPASEVDPWVAELQVKKARYLELRELAGLTGSPSSVVLPSSVGSASATNNMYSIWFQVGYPISSGRVSFLTSSKLFLLIWMLVCCALKMFFRVMIWTLMSIGLVCFPAVLVQISVNGSSNIRGLRWVKR